VTNSYILKAADIVFSGTVSDSKSLTSVG
jgi:hypothetical protein